MTEYMPFTLTKGTLEVAKGWFALDIFTTCQTFAALVVYHHEYGDIYSTYKNMILLLLIVHNATYWAYRSFDHLKSSTAILSKPKISRMCVRMV